MSKQQADWIKAIPAEFATSSQVIHLQGKSYIP
jgi:hypothetical protein